MVMLTLGMEQSQKNRLQDSATSTCQKAHVPEVTTASMFTMLKERAVARKDVEKDVVAIKGGNKTHPQNAQRLATTVEK